MNTSVTNFPHLDTELSQFSVYQLLHEAQDAPKNLNPKVIFLACSGLIEQIGTRLGFSVFECNNLHDFLRIGLNRNSFVLVTIGKRQECSLSKLKELLSVRTKHPFSIIVHDQQNGEELLLEIQKEYQKVQKLASIEKIISEKAEEIVNREPKLSGQSNSFNLIQRNEYKYSREFLRLRVSEFIEKKPEDFLENAINQIRKPFSKKS